MATRSLHTATRWWTARDWMARPASTGNIMQFSMPESSQRAAEALPEGAVREPPCTYDARPPGTWARGGGGGGPGAQKPASVHHRCTKKDGASGGGDEANDNRRACGVDGWLVRALLSARQPLVRHPPRHSLHLCGSRPASRGYVLLMYSPRNISSRGRLAATKVQAVAGVLRGCGISLFGGISQQPRSSCELSAPPS